ncbi:hypothetical protein ACFL6R_01780 [Gemmatimonadota bacterium]
MCEKKPTESEEEIINFGPWTGSYSGGADYQRYVFPQVITSGEGLNCTLSVSGGDSLTVTYKVQRDGGWQQWAFDKVPNDSQTSIRGSYTVEDVRYSIRLTRKERGKITGKVSEVRINPDGSFTVEVESSFNVS